MPSPDRGLSETCSILDSDGSVSTAVGVVDHCVERLVNPLPENHRWCGPVNMPQIILECAPSPRVSTKVHSRLNSVTNQALDIFQLGQRDDYRRVASAQVQTLLLFGRRL